MTSYPSTQYRLFVPTDKVVLARAFSIFGHMLLSAKLEKCIERERHVITGEFRRYYSSKLEFDLGVRERKALYAGDWLERFVIPLGSPESIGRITQSELQSHYDTYYTPANISIVGVGGMKLLELVELLSESAFAIRKEGVRTPIPSLVTDVAPPSENRYIFEMSKHIDGPPLEAGTYRSVAKIPGNINGRAIHIMKKMLNELLNEEVRERRAWAYAIGSSRHFFRHLYEFSISCGGLALEAIDGIEEVVEACIVSTGDREDLFEQAKRRTLVIIRMIDPTGKGICDGALEDLADDHRIISIAEIIRDLERVTMGDIRSLLRYLRPERRWTLIVRP